MKKITFLLVLLMTLITKSNGQINPIQNLTYSQTYVTPNNYFELNWDEPAQPHNQLIGYNIYRENEFYTFQTEKTLYNLFSEVFGFISNCGIDFLDYNVPNGFLVHVRAVYDGQIESTFTETAEVYAPALRNDEFNSKKVLLFPNPTKGILNIENINMEEIVVYEISGKELLKFSPKKQIDISCLSKGFYIIKLFSENKIVTEKIIVE